MTEAFSIDTNQASNPAFVMTWFKLYCEFASDPKVQSMPEQMQRRLVMLFCLHCSGDLAKLDDDELAMAMRIDAKELEKTQALFRRKGFIGQDSWLPTNWEKRQASPDRTAAERMRRYRERLREQDRNVTGNVTGNGSATDGVMLRVEAELELDCCAAVLPAHARETAIGELSYPDPDTSMMIIAQGPHPMEEGDARSIFSGLWHQWRNERVCNEFYRDQRFYPAPTWRAAIENLVTRGKRPNSIGLVKTIAGDFAVNGIPAVMPPTGVGSQLAPVRPARRPNTVPKRTPEQRARLQAALEADDESEEPTR